MNLDDLEAKARAATQPSPWTTITNDAAKGNDGHSIVLDANGMWVADCGIAPADARHIAAASPSVVLELIARLRAAEQAADVAEKLSPRLEPFGNGDWACAECRPESDILVAGFQCHIHALRTALSTYRAARGEK